MVGWTNLVFRNDGAYHRMQAVQLRIFTFSTQKTNILESGK